jgi:MoxR-like ATPase
MNTHTTKLIDQALVMIEDVWPRTWANLVGRLCLRRADGKILALYEDVRAADLGAFAHISSLGFDPDNYASPPITECPPIIVVDHREIIGAFHTHDEADAATDAHVRSKVDAFENALRARYRRTPLGPPR